MNLYISTGHTIHINHSEKSRYDWYVGDNAGRFEFFLICHNEIDAVILAANHIKERVKNRDEYYV